MYPALLLKIPESKHYKQMIVNQKLAFGIIFTGCILVSWLCFQVFNTDFSSTSFSGIPLEGVNIENNNSIPLGDGGAESFTVSQSKEPPVFYDLLTIDPFEATNGVEQTFSIWAKDTEGIEKVIGRVTTDTSESVFEFKLLEGTTMDGKWVGSWIVKDASKGESYPTEIRASTKRGEETLLTCFWYIYKKRIIHD